MFKNEFFNKIINRDMKFQVILNYLRKIPYINKGGCGIAALSMYRWLKSQNKLKGDEHFVFLYDEYHYNFEKNEKYINNQRKVIVSAHHVGFYYNGKIIDSDGEVDLGYYHYTHKNIDEETLVKSINNIKEWNPTFDRNVIPIIECILGISLKDIKKPRKKVDILI